MRVSTGPMIIDLADARLVGVHRHTPPPAIVDVGAAVGHALENPLGFPALRRALTPDDHVAIVVDGQFADLPGLLTPIVEHLAEARIAPEAITILVSSAVSRHDWPSALAHVNLEEHSPENRKKLSYLATTKHGRRVYLNRTAVDAHQLVVLSRRYYDPLLGIGGAEGALFPALSDLTTQREFLASLSMAAPGSKSWPARQEAVEVAWLLGAPFFVQIIEGAGDNLSHILGSLIDTSAEGQRLLDASWRVQVDEPADVVIAQVSGDPDRQTFAALARAAACASRVVAPEGRIIVVSGGTPVLGPGLQLLRQTDSADESLRLLKEQQPADLTAAFQWASAARRANLCLVSRLPDEVVEEIFATPLENAGQIERLARGRHCLFLEDADKMLAVEK